MQSIYNQKTTVYCNGQTFVYNTGTDVDAVIDGWARLVIHRECYHPDHHMNVYDCHQAEIVEPDLIPATDGGHNSYHQRMEVELCNVTCAINEDRLTRLYENGYLEAWNMTHELAHGFNLHNKIILLLDISKYADGVVESAQALLGCLLKCNRKFREYAEAATAQEQEQAKLELKALQETLHQKQTEFQALLGQGNGSAIRLRFFRIFRRSEQRFTFLDQSYEVAPIEGTFYGNACEEED